MEKIVAMLKGVGRTKGFEVVLMRGITDLTILKKEEKKGGGGAGKVLPCLEREEV